MVATKLRLQVSRFAVAATTAVGALVGVRTEAIAQDLNLRSASRDEIIALMMRANPNYSSDQEIKNFLDTVFCDRVQSAQNEFDRRDVVRNLVEKLRRLSQASSGILTGIKVYYDLGEYDFQRGGFPVLLSRFEHENSRPIYNLIDANNRCWRGLGTLSSIPSQVNFWPVSDQIRRFINIPEDKARNIVAQGRPRYRIIFDLRAKGVGVGPLGSPRFNITGDITNVNAALIGSNEQILLELSSRPTVDEAAAAIRPQCERELERLSQARNAMQKKVNSSSYTDGKISCYHLPLLKSLQEDIKKTLDKCKDAVANSDLQIRTVNTDIAASNAMLVQSCGQSAAAGQPVPPAPAPNQPAPPSVVQAENGTMTFGRWNVTSNGMQSQAKLSVGNHSFISALHYACAANGNLDMFIKTKNSRQFGIELAGNIDFINPDVNGRVPLAESAEIVKAANYIEREARNQREPAMIRFSTLEANSVHETYPVDFTGFSEARTRLRGLCKGAT